jgi:hypothetical protein
MHGGHRREREELPRRARIREVPLPLQIRIECLLHGPYLGLPGDMAQRGLKVAPYLHGPHHPVAVQEDGGTQQCRRGVHAGLG